MGKSLTSQLSPLCSTLAEAVGQAAGPLMLHGNMEC